MSGCRKCDLWKRRKHEVPGRGVVPCDVMFVGEAPGKSEDMVGEPFVGPSGRVLRKLIEEATVLAGLKAPPLIRIVNCVRCIPLDAEGKIRQPTDEEMWACFHNLEVEFYRASPRRVVLLGEVAAKNCRALMPGAVKLYHPAYMLRTGGSGTPIFRRVARDLSIVFKEALGHGEEAGRKRPVRRRQAVQPE